MTTIDTIGHIIEALAPAHLAEPWDNSGLQVGDPNWPVTRIRLALDATPTVVQSACKDRIDLLITHHPLIFKPLSCINSATPTGSIIQTAMQHRLGIFCAHTNLDSATGGVNDTLADILELKDIRMLRPQPAEAVKIVFFVPQEHEERLLKALFETAAGRIGQYACCSFRHPGTGSFLPLTGSNPAIGQIGQVSHVPEIRIEAVAFSKDVAAIIDHLTRNHPYETMAYDLIPLQTPFIETGIGRIGRLDSPQSLKSLAYRLKEKLHLQHVRMVGLAELSVEVVALCSGSGGSLTADFLKSRADVYISGDMGYHDARTIEAAGKGLIDVGHFASEHLVLTRLKQDLTHELARRGHTAVVDICTQEYDPFVFF